LWGIVVHHGGRRVPTMNLSEAEDWKKQMESRVERLEGRDAKL
jgi:hypothetical protein